MLKEVDLNVLGQPLVPCSFDPLTGFFRDGCCKTDDNDLGRHLDFFEYAMLYSAISRVRSFEQLVLVRKY